MTVCPSSGAAHVRTGWSRALFLSTADVILWPRPPKRVTDRHYMKKEIPMVGSTDRSVRRQPPLSRVYKSNTGNAGVVALSVNNTDSLLLSCLRNSLSPLLADILWSRSTRGTGVSVARHETIVVTINPVGVLRGS